MMKVGFDAKRIFCNTTGLGNYGRTLVSLLAGSFPGHRYYLFTPRQTPLFPAEDSRAVTVRQPVRQLDKIFRSAWRSAFSTRDIGLAGLDVYHGLAGEMPLGIHRLPLKTVVTVHDVIFERYPRFYHALDASIYRRKIQYATAKAHLIIAVSEQTRQDLITYYQVAPRRIRVVYQGCDPVFTHAVPDAELRRVRARYGLPAEYMLSVGSVTERKNLLSVVMAMKRLSDTPPLVVVGRGQRYQATIRSYLADNHLEGAVTWLSDAHYVPQRDLAAIYQSSMLFLYPSLFEGYGIPIREALASHVPVITSRGSCFPETGGDAALYINPLDTAELADAMRRVLTDNRLAAGMKARGDALSAMHHHTVSARKTLQIYQELTASLQPQAI